MSALLDMTSRMINTVLTGTPTDQPPLLIVHGLYGSARNWGAIAKRMSEDRLVLSVDMRNHGYSDWDISHSYPVMASDLAEVIARHGAPMDVIGHSMGGKAAMVLALQHPDMLRRLIVADIAPVPYTHTQIGFIAAMRGLDLSLVDKRSDADRLLATEVEDAGIRAFLLQSLDIKARRWRLNLDVLEAEMPKIMSFPDLNAQFDGATLFISGGASDYVRPEHRSGIKTLFPKARFARIPGAGHWLHAENPRAFVETAQAFLNA